jgi:predicted ATPase
MILAYPDATIYNFSDTGIEAVKYEETEHYVVTKGFLGNPRKSLKILMNTGDEDS